MRSLIVSSRDLPLAGNCQGFFVVEDCSRFRRRKIRFPLRQLRPLRLRLAGISLMISRACNLFVA